MEDCFVESFWNTIEHAHFSVEGYEPWVVQTGKRREDREAVLVVTTRLSTESHRSEHKRDFKFGNRAKSAEACETPGDLAFGQEKAERPK